MPRIDEHRGRLRLAPRHVHALALAAGLGDHAQASEELRGAGLLTPAGRLHPLAAAVEESTSNPMNWG